MFLFLSNYPGWEYMENLATDSCNLSVGHVTLTLQVKAVFQEPLNKIRHFVDSQESQNAAF